MPEPIVDIGPEEWRDIPGFPRYRVSDLGRVASMVSGKPRLLKHRCAAYPYHRVALCNERGATLFRVHVLVLTAFRGPRPPGYEACHNDGNRDNNAIANLRWDTTAGNQRDRIKHGTRGITPAQRAAIKALRRDGVSVDELAARYNVKIRSVYRHLALPDEPPAWAVA